MNSTFSRPAVCGVGAREVEHLVGHVDADRLAGRTDTAGGDEHVGAGAGTEVEDGLALVQIGDGGRDAAAQRGGDRRAVPASASVVVERGAEDLAALRVGDARRRATAAVAVSTARAAAA